jgi:hypothetical protein
VLLQMMLPQKQAFRPDNLAIPRHSENDPLALPADFTDTLGQVNTQCRACACLFRKARAAAIQRRRNRGQIIYNCTYHEAFS